MQASPVNPAAVSADEAAARQRRVRRSALLFGLIAAGFYLAFIIMTLVRGWK